MSLVKNNQYADTINKYKNREGVEWYREDFQDLSTLVFPCIRVGSAEEQKYLLGLRKEEPTRIYKAFFMGSNKVAITSKTIGPKPTYKEGNDKTTRHVTIYEYDPKTRAVAKVGSEILLKGKGCLSIRHEIGLLKSGLPRTPPLIGTFTYIGRQGMRKEAYVSKRFDGSLLDFYNTRLLLNKRMCLVLLIQVLEILDEWEKKKLIHLDMKPENFVYRLADTYDVKADGTIYNTDRNGRLYKISKDGMIYEVRNGKEHQIKKDDIPKIEVCVIDVAGTQRADESTQIASWEKNARWTPFYSSPECVTRPPNATNQELAKHDIFSVGMIVYYMLKHQLDNWEFTLLEQMLREEFNEDQIMNIKRSWQDLDISKIDSNRNIWKVVSGMLKKEPNQRMLPAQALVILKKELVKNDPLIN